MTDNLNREVREITSREAWNDWRGKDWTVSNVDVLFNANPYADLAERVAVWSGAKERPPQTDTQRRGIILQTAFPEALKYIHPEWRLVPATTYHRIKELRFGCTPDFWIYLQSSTSPIALLEAKTVSERTWESWQGRPPLGYTLQSLGQLIITGEQRCVLAIMVVSSTLPVYLFDVERHPAAEAKILDAVAQFWAKFDAGEFPVAAPSEEIAAMLDDGSHVDLSADNYLPVALERREALVETRGSSEKEIKQIDSEIKLRLGAASTGWLEGWQLSWKSQHRNAYTVPEAEIRVLRIKRTKEMGDDVVG